MVYFGDDVMHGPERQWHLEQIRPFLEIPDGDGPQIIARYFPRVARRQDVARWRERSLEYGILELASGQVGREWVTFPGHLHRGPRLVPFPAVLEVMQGEGALYLQRIGSFGRVEEATVVWLSARDRVLLPPGYFHALVNGGGVPLVVAEAHSTHTTVEFSDVARHRGMAHYVGPDGFRQNLHYRNAASVREIAAHAMAPPAAPGSDLYDSIVTKPERFRFLHPL
jgi:oxalate decarboxylase/phosphoglucose isomerase-like protein (cupin superfamily)